MSRVVVSMNALFDLLQRAKRGTRSQFLGTILVVTNCLSNPAAPAADSRISLGSHPAQALYVTAEDFQETDSRQYGRRIASGRTNQRSQAFLIPDRRQKPISLQP